MSDNGIDLDALRHERRYRFRYSGTLDANEANFARGIEAPQKHCPTLGELLRMNEKLEDGEAGK